MKSCYVHAINFPDQLRYKILKSRFIYEGPVTIFIDKGPATIKATIQYNQRVRNLQLCFVD